MYGIFWACRIVSESACYFHARLYACISATPSETDFRQIGYRGLLRICVEKFQICRFG